MKLIQLFLFAFIICASFGCQDDSMNAATIKPAHHNQSFVLAKTGNEYVALTKNPDANVVRSRADLDKIIARGESPLLKLSQGLRDEFRSHIVEMPGSVGGMNIGILRDNLSYDDFCEVMALFGLDINQGYWGLSKDVAIIRQLEQGGAKPIENQSSIIEGEIPASDETDYPGYACIGHSTCQKFNSDYICMHSCSGSK